MPNQLITLDSFFVQLQDRDIYEGNSITQIDIQAALQIHDYTLNVIANLDISKAEEWKALGLRGDSSSTTVYFDNGSGGYTTETISENPNTFIISGNAAGNSSSDYPPLVIGTDGALWDLGVLRLSDENLVNSFVTAFVDIKVREIEMGEMTFPPTTVNANGQEELGEPNSGTNGDPHCKSFVYAGLGLLAVFLQQQS